VSKNVLEEDLDCHGRAREVDAISDRGQPIVVRQPWTEALPSAERIENGCALLRRRGRYTRRVEEYRESRTVPVWRR
jgi:hypothetical protein